MFLKRRICLDRDVSESTQFINLSSEAKLLFLYMGGAADGRGVVKSTKGLARFIMVSESAVDELEKSGFIESCGCKEYRIIVRG